MRTAACEDGARPESNLGGAGVAALIALTSAGSVALARIAAAVLPLWSWTGSSDAAVWVDVGIASAAWVLLAGVPLARRLSLDPVETAGLASLALLPAMWLVQHESFEGEWSDVHGLGRVVRTGLDLMVVAGVVLASWALARARRERLRALPWAVLPATAVAASAISGGPPWSYVFLVVALLSWVVLGLDVGRHGGTWQVVTGLLLLVILPASAIALHEVVHAMDASFREVNLRIHPFVRLPVLASSAAALGSAAAYLFARKWFHAGALAALAVAIQIPASYVIRETDGAIGEAIVEVWGRGILDPGCSEKARCRCEVGFDRLGRPVVAGESGDPVTYWAPVWLLERSRHFVEGFFIYSTPGVDRTEPCGWRNGPPVPP